MTKSEMIAWLNECARYFANRSTYGEDIAHWSNVYNAKNAKEIAEFLRNLEQADV